MAGFLAGVFVAIMVGVIVYASIYSSQYSAGVLTRPAAKMTILFAHAGMLAVVGIPIARIGFSNHSQNKFAGALLAGLSFGLFISFIIGRSILCDCNPLVGLSPFT